MLWLKVHSQRLLRACLLGSKRKLPPPASQVPLGLPSVVCCPRGMQFPGTVYICNQGALLVRSYLGLPSMVCRPTACSSLALCTSVIRVLCQALEPTAFLCTQCLQPLQKMLLLSTPVRQTAHGNLPELCRMSRPVPQNMIFIFPAFTLSPFSSIALSKSRASWHIPRAIQR